MPSPEPAGDLSGGPRPRAAGGIDRRSVVARHRVETAGIDPDAALSVGNGELCMTVDATGLQTFPGRYPVADPAGGVPGTLLSTQSQWGWHSTPRPAGADLSRTVRPYRTPRGDVGYVDSAPLDGSDDSALDEGTRWLRANPHRLDLLRIGLVVPHGSGHRAPEAAELGRCRQDLDLWTGVVRSSFTLAGRPLRVRTACHPGEDTLALRIEPVGHDPAEPGVAVRLAFPYGSQSWSNAADWSRPGAHSSDVERVPGGVLVRRRLDGRPDPLYRVRVRTSPQAAVDRTGEHELLVIAQDGVLELAVTLAEGGGGDPAGADAGAVFAASRAHWPAFWDRGAAIDLAGSTDPRAQELERRAVLSQYLTAIQCAGSLPPQETGLTCNSWRGRFHLEMHWWHAAHFALWARPDLLRRSMGFYRRILPAARATAASQGYRGARWPKQVGPDGRESPSSIGPFLLWQQPHVIHFAELLRRAGGGDAAEYGDLIEETADFMADVAEPAADGFSLGPPLVPAQESYADLRDRAHDPPFEIAYWAWALGVAQQWRVRAGLPPEPRWEEVRTRIRRPLVRGGLYPAIPIEPFTVRADHPSMVYALGPVPDTGLADREAVRATLHDVLADWDWASTWGWDYPALAMTAARLGEPETAVDALLRDTPKNRYLPNGHNRQTGTLPAYLPGNGGLLAALALMAGGWDGDGGAHAPGFPRDGTWSVRHEGFVRSP
ncbi:hypothetical protein FZ103_03835 [Streptomonospora sp. PA3]|uniref:hypothetical protein n=1 Tax=Streptomonospora sp. PA3 TaxID=2607326 RepID=UPI0012DD5A3F|nr:hypothetical protein [Streptomonospora sp. PA3]MUL40315.1 hypothetical protein [Streptomonospora sp. PA3]